MNRLIVSGVLAAIACITSAPAPGLAQPQAQPFDPALRGTEQPRADIDFPGGTIAEYVEAVAEAFGGANAVIQPGAEDMSVAPVKLTQVRRVDALIVLQAVARAEPTRRIQVIPSTEIVQIGLATRPSSAPQEVRVWSLQRLTDSGAKAEDVLSAIETAINLVPGEPQIKFHRETNLLMMRASIDQLDAAQQVLQALTQAAEQRHDAAARDAAKAPKSGRE